MQQTARVTAAPHIWHDRTGAPPRRGAMIRRGSSQFIFVPAADLIRIATDLADAHEHWNRGSKNR